MPLTTSKDMLLQAQAGGYAVAAFNIDNMEMAQAVVKAAEEINSPVIIQITPLTIRYGEISLFGGMISTLASKSKIAVALHLDHCESYSLAVRAGREGYTSLMIDGSRLPFHENVEITKKVIEMAAALDIPVEGELGAIGGNEDEITSLGPTYTDPLEAREFVKETGVFSLAVGIGTAHGIYKGAPVLDIERLKEVANAVDNPLVLHGSSGVQAEDVRKCISSGICKVNYATDLRIAFTQGIKESFENNPGVFDPKLYLAEGREIIYKTVKDRIMLCGSQDKNI